MSILDLQTRLSEAQAVTASAYSDDVYDKGKAGMLGKDMFLQVNTKGVDFDAAGAATLAVELRTSAALSSGDLDGNAVVLWKSRPFSIAELVKNQVILRQKLGWELKQYVQVFYTVATGPFTAGSLDAQFVKDVQVGDDETQ